MRHLLTAMIILAFTAASSGQFRMVSNTIPGWSVVDDSTYTATVSFSTDQTGMGYLANQIADTFRLFTGTEQLYRVSNVASPTFSSAVLTIVSIEPTSGPPTGQVMVFNPEGRATIPQTPFGGTGATAQIQAAVTTWNARQSLGAGESVYGVLADTAASIRADFPDDNDGIIAENRLIPAGQYRYVTVDRFEDSGLMFGWTDDMSLSMQSIWMPWDEGIGFSPTQGPFIRINNASTMMGVYGEEGELITYRGAENDYVRTVLGPTRFQVQRILNGNENGLMNLTGASFTIQNENGAGLQVNSDRRLQLGGYVSYSAHVADDSLTRIGMIDVDGGLVTRDVGRFISITNAYRLYEDVAPALRRIHFNTVVDSRGGWSRSDSTIQITPGRYKVTYDGYGEAELDSIHTIVTAVFIGASQQLSSTDFYKQTSAPSPVGTSGEVIKFRGHCVVNVASTAELSLRFGKGPTGNCTIQLDRITMTIERI
jgi:hypothetical protein